MNPECVDIPQACSKYCPNICLQAIDIAISPDVDKMELISL
jgi:hypothetical protein